MSARTALSDAAQPLKDAGNALFAQKRFAQAHEKYSAAIKANGNNDACAVLYANRAACSASLKKYSDAAFDAEKATELDPMYTKAWARLASAFVEMGHGSKALNAWQRAKATLPVENLTPEQMKQLATYNEGIATAKKHVAANSTVKGIYTPDSGQPWKRAAVVIEEMQRSGNVDVASSAFLITAAAQSFMEGVGYMKTIKNVPGPGGQPMIVGNKFALDAISNGAMMDIRAFHMDSTDWLDLYRKQVLFSAQANDAWNTGGPDHIIQAAQQRLRTKGWEAVKPALSTTVRAWIMNGMMTDLMSSAGQPAVHWYNNAIEVIKRGRAIWHGVSTEDRGVIFEDSFLNGVRMLHLTASMQAYDKTAINKTEKQRKKILTDLYELAEELIKDVESGRPVMFDPSVMPGYISAFWTNPLVEGEVQKAFYHKHMSALMKTPDERTEHMVKAGEQYCIAAGALPADDEKQSWYLAMALQCAWTVQAPLGDTLPVMARLRDSVPKMKRIWEHSALQLGGARVLLDRILTFEDEVRQGLKSGKYKETDRVQGPMK